MVGGESNHIKSVNITKQSCPQRNTLMDNVDPPPLWSKVEYIPLVSSTPSATGCSSFTYQSTSQQGDERNTPPYFYRQWQKRDHLEDEKCTITEGTSSNVFVCDATLMPSMSLISPRDGKRGSSLEFSNNLFTPFSLTEKEYVELDLDTNCQLQLLQHHSPSSPTTPDISSPYRFSREETFFIVYWYNVVGLGNHVIVHDRLMVNISGPLTNKLKLNHTPEETDSIESSCFLPIAVEDVAFRYFAVVDLVLSSRLKKLNSLAVNPKTDDVHTGRSDSTSNIETLKEPHANTVIEKRLLSRPHSSPLCADLVRLMSCHPLLQKSRVIQPPIMELSVPPHTQREDVITFKSDSEGVSNLGEVWDIKMKDIDQKDEIGVTNKDGIRRKNVTAPYELGSGPPYYYFSDYAVVKSIRAAARRKVEVEMMGESDCANKEGIGCRETAQDHNDDGMGKNKGSLSARRARWYSQILSQKMRVIERRCAGGDVIGGIDSLGSTADLDGKVTSQPIGTENGSSPSMFLSEVVRSKCNDFCDDIFAVNCKCTCAYPHDPQCPLLDSSQPHSSPSFSSLDLSLLEADAHWRALECVIETQTRAGAGVYNATADYHAKRIVCRRRDEGIAPTTHPHRMNSCHREVFEGGSNSVVNPTVKRTRSHYPDDFIDDTFAQQDNKQNKGRRTEECKSAIKTESLPIKESREDDTICLAQHHYNTRDDDVIKGIIDHCIKKSSTSPTSCQAGFVGPGDIHISNTHSTLKSSLHTAHYLPNTPDIMSLEHMLFTFDNNNNSKKPPSWDSEYSLLWGATTTKNGIDDCRSSSDKMPQEIYSCSKGDSEKRGPSVWHVSDRVEPSSIPLMSSSMGLTPDLIASGHLSNAHAHSLRVEIEEKLDEVLNGDPLAIACTCNDTRRALEVLREHLIKSVVLRKALARRQATLQMLQRLYSEELCPVLGCEKMETALIEKDIRHC